LTLQANACSRSPSRLPRSSEGEIGEQARQGCLAELGALDRALQVRGRRRPPQAGGRDARGEHASVRMSPCGLTYWNVDDLDDRWTTWTLV
jgi:hypothetical protein